MSPACSQAVVLPEIVTAILEQLHDTKDLCAALQVDRLRADEPTTLLWRDHPPMALAHIEDAKTPRGANITLIRCRRYVSIAKGMHAKAISDYKTYVSHV